MIPVPRAEKPADFDEQVRQRGVRWLAANPKEGRPRDFWTHCLPALREAFSSRCGYAAMYDATGGTVDHYLSVKNHRDQAYEWKNYRFASGPMNITKKNADATVLDPHEVQADGLRFCCLHYRCASRIWCRTSFGSEPNTP